MLVEKDLFYQCVFACCLEIVLFSYGSPNKFPWILNTLEIQAFHFVKVIELVVRSRDQLSRDMIKHLNKVSHFNFLHNQSFDNLLRECWLIIYVGSLLIVSIENCTVNR